jgi:uncharacterized protein YodC (DUF2158 family)
MSNQFSVGNTVQLKSGGPIMTIVSIENPANNLEKDISCMWFEEDGSLMRDSFPHDSLKEAVADIVEQKKTDIEAVKTIPNIGPIRCLYSAPDD